VTAPLPEQRRRRLPAVPMMRRVNGWLTLFWSAMIPVSAVLGWLSSVAYVSALSLWALVSGHWAAWQAARVQVTQGKELARSHGASADADSERAAHSSADDEENLATTRGSSSLI
jgi:hypothetical protein